MSFHARPSQFMCTRKTNVSEKLFVFSRDLDAKSSKVNFTLHALHCRKRDKQLRKSSFSSRHEMHISREKNAIEERLCPSFI